MKLIAELNEGGYSWSAVASFKDDGGRVFYAMESGCSCNSSSWNPWQETTQPDDPLPLTKDNAQKFIDDVTAHMRDEATPEQIRDFIAQTYAAL